MKKKRFHGRIAGSVLVFLLALSLSISPLSTMLASAADESGIVLKVTENDLTFEQGKVPDLAKYFTVYYGGQEVYALYDYYGTSSYYFTEDYDDPEYLHVSETLKLHYYNSDGEELSEAPTEAGSYTAQAECTQQFYYLYDEETYTSEDDTDYLSYFYASGYGYTYYSSETLSYTITKSADLQITAKDKSIEVYGTGEPVDLSSYFEIKYQGEVPDLLFEGYLDENRQYTSYYNYSDKWYGEEGYDPLAAVLELEYYKVNEDGTTTKLDSAPSEFGSYKVKATIPDINDKNGFYAIYPTYEDGSESCVYYYESAESKLVDFEIAVKPEGLQLVYGDEELADEDALVLSIYGDGFTEDEQGAFYNAAKETAEYIMQYSPYDEFEDTIKFYAYGTVSNESGARADEATTQEEADKDTRDTYFGTSFWDSGMQRLVSLGDKGAEKIEALNKEFIPTSDFSIIVVNSTTYGGSGGEYCIASLNSSSLDMMVHELGHTIPGLFDEYYAAGFETECANLTADPELNHGEQDDWKRFIGKNGIGVYPIEETQETSTTWYRPHQSCAMRYLGYDFCEVCKEAHRKAICQYSNVTKIFFQTYADDLITGQMPDMRQYIILRRGKNEITGDKIDESKLTLTYKDSDGNVLESAPTEVGTYTISAHFEGDDTYEAVDLPDSEYTIEYPTMKTFEVESKTCDGEPAKITCDTGIENFNEDDYTITDTYTGTLKITGEAAYESEEAPVQPGTYTLKRVIKDKDGKVVCAGTADFTISYKVNTLVNNNDPTNYPGAANYYNNQDIIIFGEGFTKDEQDEFEQKAKELYEYIISQEPFKETKLYFNFKSYNTISDRSGIKETEYGDTYFNMTMNEDGTLPEFEKYPISASGYLAYRETGGYYKAAIILVNDEVDGGAVSSDTNRVYIAADSDEDGMQYITQQLINWYAGQDTSYTGCTEDDRLALLGKLYYRWSGEEYPLIVSRAYDETFLYTGDPVDLTDYFETYLGTKKMTPSKGYKLTYYKDNNGEPGEKLDSAPSEVGTYHAKIEFVTESGQYEDGEEYQFATLLDAEGNENEYPAMPARGETTFTIEETTDPTDPTDPTELKVQLNVDSLTTVPKNLQTEYGTIEEIRVKLVDCMSVEPDAKNVAYYDVTLEIYNEETGQWDLASEEDFLARGGITVTLPYPEGTGKDTHSFVVSHMITVGDRAGEVEYPTVNQTENGLVVTFTGLSPVAIVWTERPEPSAGSSVSGGTQGTGTSANTTKTSASAKSTATNTGDTASVALYLMLAAAGAVAVAGVLVVKRRKRI